MYTWQAIPSCLRLFMQLMRCPLAFASDSAGSSSAARIAMIAITTRISISVKADFCCLLYIKCSLSFYASSGPGGSVRLGAHPVLLVARTPQETDNLNPLAGEGDAE